MTRTRSHRAVPATILLLAACADAPMGPPPGDPGGLTGDLSFVFPAFVRGPLVEPGIEGPPPLGPARVIESDEEAPPSDQPLSPSDLPAAGIWDEWTRAGFQPGSAWASGFHRYQGNKGSISTTVKVMLDGVQIGSQTATRQDDLIFWLDFGIAKEIGVITRAYVDQECGLSTSASSRHAAWWEAIPGANIATFGRVERSSESDLARQPECPIEPPTPPTGGGGGSDGGLCYVSVWYYEDTGEVVSRQVLYCESAEGG